MAGSIESREGEEGEQGEGGEKKESRGVRGGGQGASYHYQQLIAPSTYLHDVDVCVSVCV